VLSLFVISTVSIIAAATIHQARTQERAALAIAKKEQAEKTIALESEKLAHQAAVTQLQSARESIDDWILGLDADLGLYPGLSPLRMHLQDKADAHYRVLSRQSTTTPLMSLEVARAKIRLAEIEYAKQNAKESESLFQSAITQLEHEPFPFDTDWHDIATIQMALAKVGFVKVRVNSSPEADNELDIIDSACSELESISDRSPVSAEARTALAKAIQVKAAALFAFGDPTGAQSEAERALVVADKLETRDKQACSHRLLLSLLEDLARYRLAQNHYADALSAYRQTIAVYDAMLSGGRLRPDWLESRANAKVQAALCHSQMIQPNEAVTNLESAETDLKHAWEIFGGVSVFHDKVSQVYKSLGYSFLLVGDSEQAERVLSQSIDSMQRSLRDSIPTMHSALQFAQSYLWMAIAIESNSSTDFSKQLDLAAKEIAKLVEWKCQDPSIPFMQMQHAWLLGRHQCREGALDDAEATLQRALANAMTTDPNNAPPDQLLVRGRILRVLARIAKRRSNEQTMNEKLAEARHYWQIAQQAGGRVGATAAFERLESMCEDSSLMESESIQAWTLAKELTTKYETSPRAWFLMAEAAFLRNELEVARTALSKVERLRRSTPEDRLLKELIEQKNASDSTIGVEARHAGISERNAVTCLPDTHAEFLLHLLDDKSRPTR
jgi:tetratricopeptide (TPR) repeat protein